MDASIATVLVSLVTGIFSVITYRMKRNERLLNDKFDQQNMCMSKEAEIRKAILEAEKKRNGIIEQIMIFLIKSTSYLLLTSNKTNNQLIDELQTGTIALEDTYRETIKELNDLYNEHDVLVAVINKIQGDIANLQSGKINDEPPAPPFMNMKIKE